MNHSPNTSLRCNSSLFVLWSKRSFCSIFSFSCQWLDLRAWFRSNKSSIATSVHFSTVSIENYDIRKYKVSKHMFGFNLFCHNHVCTEKMSGQLKKNLIFFIYPFTITLPYLNLFMPYKKLILIALSKLFS